MTNKSFDDVMDVDETCVVVGEELLIDGNAFSSTFFDGDVGESESEIFDSCFLPLERVNGLKKHGVLFFESFVGGGDARILNDGVCHVRVGEKGSEAVTEMSAHDVGALSVESQRLRISRDTEGSEEVEEVRDPALEKIEKLDVDSEVFSSFMRRLNGHDKGRGPLHAEHVVVDESFERVFAGDDVP